MFYDGPKSKLDYRVAKCGIPSPFICNVTGTNPPQTVGFQFGPDQTAITVTPSSPYLLSFWQPVFTPPGPNDKGFGVGINPTNSGVNIYNESTIFHEAIHGFAGLNDAAIEGYLPGVTDPSVNISIYIRDNVLSKCPSFR